MNKKLQGAFGNSSFINDPLTVPFSRNVDARTGVVFPEKPEKFADGHNLVQYWAERTSAHSEQVCIDLMQRIREELDRERNGNL